MTQSLANLMMEMTKLSIALASDLHIEMQRTPIKLPPLPLQAEVLVLAGDITNRYQKTRHSFAATFAALRRVFDRPVLYIPGNHEYYGSDYDELNQQLPTICQHYDITLLQRNYADIENVRFFGCTLWSNFLLNGHQEMPWAIHKAQGKLADYRAIRYQGRLMEAPDTRQLFHEDIAWLENGIRQCPDDKEAVICTHFAPHPGCLSPAFAGDDLNPYFVNDLSDFITEYAPALWLCGHTHHNIDYQVGKTRIVSNQLGYQREQTAYNPALYLTI